jgi:protoheme IX farnesyltransferase
MKSAITSYINLTKPTIVLLFTLTGLASMVIEGSLLATPLKFFIVLFCIAITAGSANSLNMYFDRDIDEIMKRTKRKRPLPLKTVTPNQALIFGLVLGAIAIGTLLFLTNILTAFLGLATILFYVCFYTLYLKRRTPYNIVIGGAAGATAPLMGWAAGSGHISFLAWILFTIIFMWTPPHFWALALVVKEDYRDANVPMLPVVAGDKRTRLEILIYSLILIPLTLVPVLIRTGGVTYLISSILLGALFLRQVFKMMSLKTEKSAYAVFGYSIVYLLALFIFLIIGSVIHRPPSIA